MPKQKDDMDKWDEALSNSGMGERCDLRTALKNCFRLLENRGMSEQDIRSRVFSDPGTQANRSDNKNYSCYSLSELKEKILYMSTRCALSPERWIQSISTLNELLNAIETRRQEFEAPFFQRMFSDCPYRSLLKEIKQAVLNVVSKVKLVSLTTEVDATVTLVKKIMSTHGNEFTEDDRYDSFLIQHQVLLDCHQLRFKSSV